MGKGSGGLGDCWIMNVYSERFHRPGLVGDSFRWLCNQDPKEAGEAGEFLKLRRKAEGDKELMKELVLANWSAVVG